MKLSELKNIARSYRSIEYDEYCFSKRDAEQFNAGFDAGAKAVMDEAEKLADALEYFSSSGYIEKTFTEGFNRAKQSRARWNKFKEGNDEPG